MSKQTFDRDPWELVAESFLARYRTGERPSIEEYATRHPELADQIRRLMPALVIMEQDLSLGFFAYPPEKVYSSDQTAKSGWTGIRSNSWMSAGKSMVSGALRNS